MIDRTTLSRIARMKGISNMDHASKDYFQEIVLLSVSREFPALIFKGGTCLYKFHGLDRFSEDIDLVGPIEEKDLERIGRYLADYGYPNDVKAYGMASGLLATFRIKGFLYSGEDVTMTRIRMDITEKDTVILPPVMSSLYSLYPDIPRYQVMTMDPREVLAEKFRSLFQRSRSRDLYDLSFLIDMKIEVDPELIRKKFDAYDIAPSSGDLEGSIDRIAEAWGTELRPVLGRVPDIEGPRSMAHDVLEAIGE